MVRILIVAGNGTVSDHLDYAHYRMLEEGFEPTIAAPVNKPLITAIHQGIPGEPAYQFERQGYVTPVNAAFDDIDPTRYDALLLPGGRAPEYLRNNDRCVELVRHFVANDKPIGAICHGPLLLLAAGVTGRNLSGLESIAVEIEACGNRYVEAKGLTEGQTDHALDGNIVSVRRRPYHYVWIREFLSLLKAHGIQRSNEHQLKPIARRYRVLLIAADFCSGGQLLYVNDRMREEGFDVSIAAPEKRRLNTVVDMREEGWDYDFERLGFWMPADAALDDINPSSFDALILPGWRAAEYLRDMESCRSIVRHFVESNKPIGAMCQGARMLIAAGVKGRRLTGADVIKSEIARTNTFIDAGREAVVDGNIATATRRPYYHVWMRAFMSLVAQHHERIGT